MDNLDIPALAERIREHRFTGYTENMLADEIERFRAGPGASGIGDAVDALKAVATSLSETDETLREELAKLGVEWQSEAAEQAGAALTEHARFSRDANDKVLAAAQLIFAQGEAFNRTLHKLPDPQTLRAGAGGYDAADSVLGLLGFETDHARKVAAAMEAKQQAVEALDSYARDSGENLSGTEELGPPQALRATMAPRLPEVVDAGGGPGDVTIAAGTTSAQAPTASPASAPSPGPVAPPAAAGPAPVASAAPAPIAPAPAPSAPAAGTGSAVPAPERTAPSGVTGTSSAPGGTATGGGPSGGFAGASRSGGQSDPAAGHRPGAGTAPPAAPGTSGGTPGSPTGPGPGSGSGAGSGTGGPRLGGVPGKVAPPGAPGSGAPGGTAVPPAAGMVGKVGVPGAGAPGDNSPEQHLAKGRSSGAAPQPVPPGTGTGGGSFATSPRGGLTANDIGAGAAALGAGGVAGALSGDGERRGRGVGRSAPGAARSPHQLPMGELPEEEARAQRNSERLSPRRGPQQGGLLEKAAGQGDGDHVRRFGVDDNDLFTDERLVSPDVIGDDGVEGRR
ncbi:PPE family protein [Prauserella shujinwangii]|uniref:PPE family protein n=1 Tax=Prauserella shujinwangii TaxID=1453103 RepID=A0A2T0LUG2_9PSEU|nr:PPE domain-containing protein [Prauserella shujinwangii]PRX47482.1 PPE family protein [Prauserella shujinwangii]